jgi:hypothetical protein
MDPRIRIRIHTKMSWIRNTALRPLSMVAALVRPKERETKQFILIPFRYFFVLLPLKISYFFSN